ncbi:MobA/MobL family protein [Loktanella sp. DJP18]|uniref:MobA/MobL family protein n=1 Tax=Loktanella sp. DJP18 TaxID=3409788 RepID=UPI003BB6005C
MMTYAATINIRHISTSAKSRGGLSINAAKKAAFDNLTYICRTDAAADFDIIGHCQGETLIAEDATDRAAMREMSRWAIDARAERHTEANGIRLADKLIVSLPRDATWEHHREMVAAIISDLGRDSDAWLVAAIHRDRKGNPHAHILAIDGLETHEAAKARRPDAQRVRRRDMLRLNEGGNRQSLRVRIAAQINAISLREGYRVAEVRSLAEQGIERIAQAHIGPRGSARRTRREVDAWIGQDPEITAAGWDWLDGQEAQQPPTRSGSSLFALPATVHEAEQPDEARSDKAR